MINLTTLRLKTATTFSLILFAILTLGTHRISVGQETASSVIESRQEIGELPSPAADEIDLSLDLKSQSVLQTDEIETISPVAPNVENDDIDILTRGPLHEAFATAHQSNPEPSPTVTRKPPATIEEVPPEFKPEGNNVNWIPGYWAWDDAQTDFIWISGVWRDVPPGRRWVPGYWEEVAEENGFRWVSGFWIDEAAEDVEYIPDPPASIDNGPSTVAPSNNHFYVPGNWSFHNGHYRWYSGHWQPVVKNWIWIPARYVWTPRGCVYVSGYWDYEIEYRGTCFAPVYFQRPVYTTYRYTYTPSYSVNINIDFLTHLFVRPRCGHYYYGDWYNTSFVSFGYKPWVHYQSHYRRYDPLLAYYKCRPSVSNHRYNVVQYLAQQHHFYANHHNFRPRPTVSAHFDFVKNSKHLKHHAFAQKTNYVKQFQKLHRQQANQLAAQKRDLNRGNRKLESDLKRQQAKWSRVEEAERKKAEREASAIARLKQQRKTQEINARKVANFKALKEGRAANEKLHLPNLKKQPTDIAKQYIANSARKNRPTIQNSVREQLQRDVQKSRQNAAAVARKNELELKKKQRAVELAIQRQKREKERQQRLQSHATRKNNRTDVTKKVTSPSTSNRRHQNDTLKNQLERDARQRTQQLAVKQQRELKQKQANLQAQKKAQQQAQNRKRQNEAANRLRQTKLKQHQHNAASARSTNSSNGNTKPTVDRNAQRNIDRAKLLQQQKLQQQRNEQARRQKDQARQAQQRALAQKRQQDQARRAQENAKRAQERQRQDQARRAQSQARRQAAQRAAAERQRQRQQKRPPKSNPKKK